jgi:hypothetical protein
MGNYHAWFGRGALETYLQDKQRADALPHGKVPQGNSLAVYPTAKYQGSWPRPVPAAEADR